MIDKPLIQYVVEEAAEAGITEIIFVTSSAKRGIGDHFDKNHQPESKLGRKQKYDLLAELRVAIPKGVSCVYARQPEALGLGYAVLCARPIVGNEPFAALLTDDLLDYPGNEVHSKSMIRVSFVPSKYRHLKLINTVLLNTETSSGPMATISDGY